MLRYLKIFSAACLAAAVAASCVKPEAGSFPRIHSVLPWKENGKDSEKTVKARSYITGVRYPKGYDWKSDSGYGLVDAVLFMVADGDTVLRLPTGKEYEILPDEDMHRVVEGNLYTDFSSEKGTLVKKNGKTLFSYGEREMITGFAVAGDDVYTIGQPRSGKGFSYRKNGSELLSCRNGIPISELYEAGGRLYFAYIEWFEVSGGVDSRYFLVEDGKAVPVGLRSDIDTVYAVRMVGDRLCYVAGLTGNMKTAFFVGDDNYFLTAVNCSGMRNFRIMEQDGFPCVACEVIYSNNIDEPCFAVFKGAEMQVSYHWIYSVKDFFISDGKCFGISSNEYKLTKILYEDRWQSIAREYYSGYGKSALSSSGDYWVLLVPEECGIPPAVWKNGETEISDFNGYFTSVTFEEIIDGRPS